LAPTASTSAPLTASKAIVLNLKKSDSFGKHEGHHHCIEMGFVAGVEGNKVRLTANAEIAVTLEEEPSGRPVRL
jgi:hypothetical protein